MLLISLYFSVVGCGPGSGQGPESGCEDTELGIIRGI